MTYSPAFWSQALVSQSAASAAGTLPPMTNPKKRGPAVAMRPPSALAARASTTSTGSSPDSGSGPPNRRRSSSSGTVGATGRSGRPATKARAMLGGPLERGVGRGAGGSAIHDSFGPSESVT